MKVTVEDIKNAINSASKGRSSRSDVLFVLQHRTQCTRIIYEMLENDTYMEHVRYRELEKKNNNGKRRHILSPELLTLILQHLCINLLLPKYESKDNLNGLNCKTGCGITAKNRKKSVIKRLKHIFYDERRMNYVLFADQRECYGHVTKKLFRRRLKKLGVEKGIIDFATNICFVGNVFPIGTPTSPLAHHIIMLDFDRFVRTLSPCTVRYADDNLLAFETKEEANRAKWRIKNYWWYELGIRAKRHTTRIVSMDKPFDFCGHVYHRNKGKGKMEHNKGYVTIRKDTERRAKKCRTNESWASYFGMMACADTYNLMRKIEKNMKLRELTEKVRIDRKLDAKEITVKELADTGQMFTVYDYDLRTDSKGTPNWIKCLIGIPEIDGTTGEMTGKILAREFHGGLSGIVAFHAACEKEFGGKENILPLEEMTIESHCGYIYTGSTNMIDYIS